MDIHRRTEIGIVSDLELNSAREQIRTVDLQMRDLFLHRLDAMRSVADWKKERGLPVEEREQELQILSEFSAGVTEEAQRSFYLCFLQNVMKVSNQWQHYLMKGLRAAYSGVEGAFAHVAAMRVFPDGTAIPYASFEDAYHSVETGDCDVAVLPIENSYAGEVGQTMDLIFSGGLFINGIYELEIHQNLLGMPDATVDDIKKVTSHPQALSQCHDYLTLKGFLTEEANNTAVAAKMVAEAKDKTFGAIASLETAELYGLKVLEANINKSGENTTRFAVLSKVRAGSPSLSNSVVMFTVKNEAGSLANAISIIGKYGYNMTTLRSRPLKKHSWQYYFYIEIDGSTDTAEGRQMIEELNKVCDKLKVAGTFAPHTEI